MPSLGNGFIRPHTIIWKMKQMLKLELVFKQKIVGNKILLLKKLENIKLREKTLMTDHLNDFQSIVSQLVVMKMVIDDTMQASLLLCSLSKQLGNFCCDY